MLLRSALPSAMKLRRPCWRRFGRLPSSSALARQALPMRSGSAWHASMQASLWTWQCSTDTIAPYPMPKSLARRALPVAWTRRGRRVHESFRFRGACSPHGRGRSYQAIALAGSLNHAPHWPRMTYLDVLNPEWMPRRIALVVEDVKTRAVVGFAVASLTAPQAELETIAVAAPIQRRGVGRGLLAVLVEELAQAGVQEVLLEVRASNHAAQGFYRSLGFSETGLRPRYYADPIEDAVLMALNVA